MALSDLDAPEQIDRFVEQFYARVLVDSRLAPLFLEVARVDLAEHLPHIKAYWRKMLLGDPSYTRHMMRRHRNLDRQHALDTQDYERWLQLFLETLDSGYRGPVAERARELARRVAGNMRRNLEQARSCT